MKKYISLMLCTIMLSCAVFGCETKEKLQSKNLDSTTTEIENKETKINASIKLFGTNLELPCKFSDLSDVTFDSDTALWINDTTVYGAIYSGIYRIGRVEISNCTSKDEDMSDKYIKYLQLSPDCGFDNLDFEYNGFIYATTKEQIIKAFGTPDEEFNNNICYYLDSNDTYVEFEFGNENSEIKSIAIKVD